MEIEGFKFLINGIRGAYIVDCPVNLKAVVVYDYDQIIQLMVSGQHGSLPYLAFLNLSVTQQGIGCLLYTSRGV